MPKAEAQTTTQIDERSRYLKHAHRQSFTERAPHSTPGRRADLLQQAADLRLAAGLLDRNGATEMKRLARQVLRKLPEVSP